MSKRIEKDLFDSKYNTDITEEELRSIKPLPIPALTGSGPIGETCATCLHAKIHHEDGKTKHRCRKIIEYSDDLTEDERNIKLDWKSCSKWEKR